MIGRGRVRTGWLAGHCPGEGGLGSPRPPAHGLTARALSTKRELIPWSSGFAEA